jgi:hypothetical protein
MANEFLDYLKEPVKFKRLLGDLDFPEEELARAAREQPSLFLEASRYRVRCMRRRIRAKAALESVYSEVALRYREKKQADKLTEKAIANKVIAHPNVITAQKELDSAEVAEEYSKLLVEAYRQRKDACKILADILGQEMHAEVRLRNSALETAGMGKLKEKVKRKFQQEDE